MLGTTQLVPSLTFVANNMANTYKDFTWCQTSVLSTLHVLLHLTLNNSYQVEYYCYLHFVDEETEAKKG